eukprot:CAMPEP_0182452046 /NCGR_PEP_ID=MMETSP1172-20130603/44045_1 /TAXON_ID=708627 /ORGANISM="Timspurckia oligopyrenoides, Strain CCMP3278" /LENGTH=194 /DNA_ID=CAMNT_0024649859 /DNA_START=160 /DNA_END=744 /DNA_ORIENTATION=-
MTTSSSSNTSIKVLFVCLGNICRSPTAEAVFRSIATSSSDKLPPNLTLSIDSCGTGGGNPTWYQPNSYSYHEGDPSDSRMTIAAKQRGIELTSRSRPLVQSDITEYDYIVAMDQSNVKEILKAAKYWGGIELEQTAKQKTVLMMQFHSNSSSKQAPVPDPYYGGSSGFELVLDLLDDACTGLFNSILQTHTQQH